MDIQFEEDGKCPAFLAFAKSRPQDQEVDLSHSSECALAQFLRANGDNRYVKFGELSDVMFPSESERTNRFALPEAFERRLYNVPADQSLEFDYAGYKDYGDPGIVTWAEIVARMEA